MSQHDDRKKLKYESPILVSLGEMAKGSGACGTGYIQRGGPYDDTECTAGGSPVGYCSAGDNATNTDASYCTAGECALDYCTSSGVTAAGGACTTSGFTATSGACTTVGSEPGS